MPDATACPPGLGSIRCKCGGEMEIDERKSEAAAGACFTVECRECREVGGYNTETLATYGAVDALELVGT